MSRSRKKSPHMWVGSSSAKDDKSRANRSLRRIVNVWLSCRRNLDLLTTYGVRDVSDPWGWGVDGKFRFDPDEYPYLMRK